MKTAIISVTDSSEKVAVQLAKQLEADTYRPDKGGLRELVAEIFTQYEGLVFIMASGIVIRMIAPLITDKYHDPAVVTVDDACRYAISTLSGHEGGANDLCWKVASYLGAEAVITTASDTNRNIVLGVGCRKNTSSEDIKDFVGKVLEEHQLSVEQIRCAASAEVKKEEEGLIRAFDELGIPLVFHTLEDLRHTNFPGLSPAGAAARHFDVPGVCEPCALLSARRGTLIQKKIKDRGITIALVKESI